MFIPESSSTTLTGGRQPAEERGSIRSVTGADTADSAAALRHVTAAGLSSAESHGAAGIVKSAGKSGPSAVPGTSGVSAVSSSLIPTSSKIGLSLSGGGIRAAIFHLGVLQWLAELGLLENLRHISTVSGASLAIALVYARSDGRFPDSRTYLEQTLPAVRATILKQDIQDRALMSLTVRPWNWKRKANLMAEAITRLWEIRGRVCDLPADPLWSINCTTFETGKDFRITPLEMGDYKVGYVPRPTLSIAEAAAASAGFPVLIGPYRLTTRSHQWTKPRTSQDPVQVHAGTHCSGHSTVPDQRTLHLWDGGVYDNLGLEALYKIDDGGHLTGGLTHLIISNASSSSGRTKRDFFSPVKNLRRLLDITMDQVDALRSRDVTDYLYRMGNGCYLRIGTPACGGAPQTASGDTRFNASTAIFTAPDLSEEQISYVKNYPTTLSSPTPEDFDLILRHGYQVARDKIFTPERVPSASSAGK